MNKQEIIKRIEDIEQRLTSLQLTMELLSTHTEVIKVFSIEDFKSLNTAKEELYRYWDKVNDAEKLHMLTHAITCNSSEELSSICYEKLDELKKVIKDVM